MSKDFVLVCLCARNPYVVFDFGVKLYLFVCGWIRSCFFFSVSVSFCWFTLLCTAFVPLFICLFIFVSLSKWLMLLKVAGEHVRVNVE